MEGRMFEVRSVDVSLMNPAPYNPRVDLKPTDEEYRHIRNSVQRFGYLSPIVWNERTGNIVSGHQRFKVLLEQGATSIDCCVVDFDEEKEKACNLAMNKAQGLWDEAKLDILLDELKATDWAMEDFGFDLSSDGDLYEVDEVEEDGFDAQDAVEDVVEPITKSGDIWQMGRHRLMCGDSTDIESVQALMDGFLADMCITDPPYNVAVENSKGKRIMNDDMEDSSFSAFLDKAFACISANLRKGGVFYIWYGDSQDVAFRTNCTKNGLSIKECLIWVKNSFVLGRQDYQWRHEPCLYGWKEGAAHHFVDDRTQDTVLEDKVDVNAMNKEQLKAMCRELLKDRVASTVIREDKPVRDEEHPTMKPLKLFGRLVRNSSRRGERVLDTFGGSGTTAIVCEQLGRSAYLMELDPVYCDVIVRRWEEFTGRKAVLLSRH